MCHTTVTVSHSGSQSVSHLVSLGVTLLGVTLGVTLSISGASALIYFHPKICQLRYTIFRKKPK